MTTTASATNIGDASLSAVTSGEVTSSGVGGGGGSSGGGALGRLLQRLGQGFRLLCQLRVIKMKVDVFLFFCVGLS